MKKLIGIFVIAALTITSCSKKEGCTDSKATNFDSKAEKDNGSCTYATTTDTTGDGIDDDTVNGGGNNGGGSGGGFVEDSSLFDKVVYRISLDFKFTQTSEYLITSYDIYQFSGGNLYDTTCVMSDGKVGHFYKITDNNLKFTIIDTTFIGDTLIINTHSHFKNTIYETKKYIGGGVWSDFNEIIKSENDVFEYGYKLVLK